MTLEERVFEVVRRYKLAMEGLERTTDALHRTARAMDKQQVEAENAGRHSKEERRVLVSTAIASLQHLRTHLLATLGSVYDLRHGKSGVGDGTNSSPFDVSMQVRTLKASGSLPTIASPYSSHVRAAQPDQDVVPKLPMPGGGVPLGYPLHLVRPSPAKAAGNESLVPESQQQPASPLLGVLRHTTTHVGTGTTSTASPHRSPTKKHLPPHYLEHVAAYDTSRREAIRILVAESDAVPGRIRPALLHKWAAEELAHPADELASGGEGTLQLRHRKEERARAAKATARARAQAIAATESAAKVHDEFAEPWSTDGRGMHVIK